MLSSGSFLPPSSSSCPLHLRVAEVLLLHCWAPERECRFGEGTCSSSLTLAGTLGPSCCNVSLTVLPQTKALTQQPSSLGSLTPPGLPRSPRGFRRARSEDLSAALALCLPERKPSQQALLSVSGLFQLPEDCVGWGLGSLSPSPSCLSPPGCCNLWPQPCFAPLAPQGPRRPQSPLSLFGWKPALPLPAVGRLAKSWRARAGGLGLISPAWH